MQINNNTLRASEKRGDVPFVGSSVKKKTVTVLKGASVLIQNNKTRANNSPKPIDKHKAPRQLKSIGSWCKKKIKDAEHIVSTGAKKIVGAFKKGGERLLHSGEKLGKKMGQLISDGLKTLKSQASKAAKSIKKGVSQLTNVAKQVGSMLIKAGKNVSQAIKRTLQSFNDTLKNAIDFCKYLSNGLTGALTLNQKKFVMSMIHALSSGIEGVINVGKTILNGASVLTAPLSKKAADKLQGAANKLANINNTIAQGLESADVFANSVFYKGPHLKTNEIKTLPPQVGPKGTYVPIDMKAFNKASKNDDLSVLAKDLLEKNAPIVRQFSSDSYPISTNNLIKNATYDPKSNTYDQKDSFADHSSDSHKHTPTTYASAYKVNDHTIALTYDRYYANSYLPNGDSTKLPSQPQHEGDVETSVFYYDTNTHEIINATVSKHGQGENLKYDQKQIEFKNGRPVINVGMGSHATSLTSGLEIADIDSSRQVHKWTGSWLYDNYPGSKDVKNGRAVELNFSPANVIVVGSETRKDQVSFKELDRWKGALGGQQNRDESSHKYWREK